MTLNYAVREKPGMTRDLGRAGWGAIVDCRDSTDCNCSGPPVAEHQMGLGPGG